MQSEARGGHLKSKGAMGLAQSPEMDFFGVYTSDIGVVCHAHSTVLIALLHGDDPSTVGAVRVRDDHRVSRVCFIDGIVVQINHLLSQNAMCIVKYS